MSKTLVLFRIYRHGSTSIKCFCLMNNMMSCEGLPRLSRAGIATAIDVSAA